MEHYEREKDFAGNDVYSLKMLPYSKVAKFFTFDDPSRKFVVEMKGLLEGWLQRLYLLISNAEVIKAR